MVFLKDESNVRISKGCQLVFFEVKRVDVVECVSTAGWVIKCSKDIQ